MKWERKIQPLVKTISLQEEGNDVADWTSISFEDKMSSVERMRNLYFELNGKEYPKGMNRSSLTIIKRNAAVSN